jgi:GTP-binding protein
LQRTKLLLHLVDIAPLDENDDPLVNAKAIINELGRHSESLSQKDRWLVLNKTDLLLDDEVAQRRKYIVDGLNWNGPVFEISAVSGKGCQELSQNIMVYIEENKRLEGESE